MDVSESGSQPSISVADTVWKFINSPVIAILTDFHNPTAKQMLSSLLESILKGSSTLTTVLVPPNYNNGGESETILQRQYSAFTTWLFGIMFYIVGNPLSEEILEKSIEIQVCMLRILSWHHVTMFQTISMEYIQILCEILEFYTSGEGCASIALVKFSTEQDIIENLDLRTFPVEIKHSNVTLVQSSILNIIRKTGASVWHQESLSKAILPVVHKAHPTAKFIGLDICTQMVELSLLEDHDLVNLYIYVRVIVKTIPAWMNQSSRQELLQFFEVLARLIRATIASSIVMELSFEILNVLVFTMKPKGINLPEIKVLEEAVLEKMKLHFAVIPESRNSSNIKKCIAYFEVCPDFARIFINFVLADVKHAAGSNDSINVAKISGAWNSLREQLKEAVTARQFDKSLHILKASSSLQHSLEGLSLRTKLYENDLHDLLKLFLHELNQSSGQEDVVFRNLAFLFAHDEANKYLVESVLSLPFLKDTREPERKIGARTVQAAKRLGTDTLLLCVKVLCEFGDKQKVLKLMNNCLAEGKQELAAEAVLHSVLLLTNGNVTLKDLCQYILSPALSSSNEEIQKALADALGKISCYVSKTATVVRSTDDESWSIQCRRCTETIENDDQNCPTSLNSIDTLFKPFFSLIQSNFDSVRLKMSSNFLSLANHVESFVQNETAQKWSRCIQDSNAQVRLNLATVIARIMNNKIKLSKTTDSPDLKRFVDSLIETMIDALPKALEQSDHCLHESLLLTARNLARVPLYLTEKRILNIFLITILHPASAPAMVGFATTAYRDTANFLNVSTKMLYVRYKKDFLRLIIQRAVFNFINYSYNMATSVHRIARCIGYEGSRQLLRKDGHLAVVYLLSFIIDIPNVVTLLKDVADLIGMNEKYMLIEYFPHVCCHAFLNMPLRSAMECLKLVSKITRTSLARLTKQSFIGIFEELMLNFHDTPEKIIGLLKIISAYDNTQTRVNFSTQKQITSYLNLRLHGILVNFDIKLGPKSDEYTQQSALASLAVLIRYMGEVYITPLRYKILATLHTSLGLKRPGFGRLICDAWDAFVHNVAIKDLGPLLPTICVSLMSLSKTHREEVNAMLTFLIVQSNENCPFQISELFFIDDLDVPNAVSSIVKARILQARPEGFEANLELWLKRITHETDEVRARALKYLQLFLEQHRVQLNKMILSETDVHPLIVELLDTLLIGCQDPDESIRLLYGECLGELGAIEPSLLPRRIISRNDSKFISDMNEGFVSAMLLENVRAFQMQKSSQSMDCFSLAIQEILKLYDVSPNGRNSQIWNNLPANVQQIITPFLTSHYKIATACDDNELPHPIYGSDAGSSVENWAYNWLCSMSRNVSDQKLADMLRSCKLAFKRDMKVLTFCLPHVLAYVIATGTTEREHKKIREEMLAVIDVRKKPKLDPELLKHKPLRHGRSRKPDDTRVSEENKRMRCAQIVFSGLDHLQKWLWEQRLNKDQKYAAIKEFCESLDNLVVAEGCYQFREYHRALMYLEQHMASANKGLSEGREGGLLAKIYAQLDNPDGVSGILATQDHTPVLQQLVLAHEVRGQLQDAATCYERLAQKREMKHAYLQGMIQCYLGLDQPFTAKYISEGVLNNRPELQPLLVDQEPFWRLAHFLRLDDTQRSIKHVLLDDLKKGARPDLLSLKRNLLVLLEDAARPGAYQQCYSHIMKLHTLNEFDKAVGIMLSNIERLPTILEEWDKRGQLLRASRGVEFVLCMRRATLDLAVQLQKETANTENSVLKQEIGKIWLKSAKIARKSGLYQQAYMYILSASESCPPQQLYIEQAQLYWQKGCQENAFITLKRCFCNCFQPASVYKQLPSDERLEERRQCAKAKLLFAKYNDETLNVDTDVSILNYKEAIEVWRVWEKSFVACAQYYESIINRMAEEERDLKGRDLQVHMMNYYGKSLQYGCKYIHQSIPKMLTIWLEFASRTVSRTGNQTGSEVAKLREDGLMKMTKIMEVYQERLPIFMWLTAFSQLVSRICHPSNDVQSTICAILVKLILAYPQHCLWMMASVFNSSYPARQKRCQEILNHPKLRSAEIMKLIRDFTELWKQLIEVSNKAIPDGHNNTTINALSRGLPRLLASKEFSNIMMPTKKFRQLHLPPKGASLEDHNPFSSSWVHITGVGDNVVIMPSLQRPRRIILKGSDGKDYLFMCKPKDDLRRDFRLMEFNDIVNKYLQNDPESRQRRLYIRTYSVVPLNEECGLIEWVPNLVGLRPVVMNIHKERGVTPSSKELRTMLCALKDPLEKKRKMFVEKLLPRHPPVLADWYRMTFPDPYSWYEARNAYIQTTAVMSMVGYILGLGDRHGENILLDSKCGDAVHVDFNCLFNRGELFDWPERVPFRLTHNMVDAMGPLKVEGPFRRACQITLRVLREQASILLSVLRPFVYDPLVSWNKNQICDSGEKTNEKALESIKNIDQRLKGLIRSRDKKFENIGVNLSVEGQTNHLILEATSVDNLCQMYFGWGAYI